MLPWSGLIIDPIFVYFLTEHAILDANYVVCSWQIRAGYIYDLFWGIARVVRSNISVTGMQGYTGKKLLHIYVKFYVIYIVYVVIYIDYVYGKG